VIEKSTWEDEDEKRSHQLELGVKNDPDNRKEDESENKS
jgi:hypothetical protein